MKKKVLFGVIGLFALIGIVGSFLFLSAFYSFQTFKLSRDKASPVGSVTQQGLVRPSIDLRGERFLPPEPPEQPPIGPQEQKDRLVVKTGFINMIVKDVVSVSGQISKLVGEVGGFVVESNISRLEDEPRGTIVVRVPVTRLDDVLEKVRSYSVKVTSEQITGEDVTSEYVDLKSQLRNLEATEAQFLKILEKAANVTEILSVQRELSQIRGQIENTKGRIEYLEKSAALSKLTINLALDEESLPATPSEKWKPVTVLKSSVRALVAFSRNFSYLAIRVIIFAPVWLPPVIALWYLRRRFRKKKSNPETD